MRYVEIPTASVFWVSGKHAERYLQARLTADVKKLTANQVVLAAQLTPQGRTQGLFHLTRREDSSFILYADGGEPSELRAALTKYIVADQVTVTDMSAAGAHIYHLVGEWKDHLPADVLVLPVFRGFEGGSDVVCLAEEALPKLQTAFCNGSQISLEELELARFRAGIPAFPKEINENFLFSESGLEAATNKGCYVGQEVVEKIESIGKTSKVLKHSKIPGHFAGDRSTAEIEGDPISWMYDSQEDCTWVFSRVRQ